MMVQETTQEQTDQESVDNTDDAQDAGQEPNLNASDLDRLQRELDKARKEAAKYRTERNDTKSKAEQFEQQIQAISKALGLTTDGSPDPEKLQQELQRMQTQYRRERVRNAFYRAADKLDADSELAWAVLQTSGDLEDLDVDSDDLDSQITDRVQALLESNTKLKKDTVKPTGAGGSNPPVNNSLGLSKPYDQMTIEEQTDLYHRDPALWERARNKVFGG